MQTNGILLNDKIKNEFDTRNIHIGISCDGCNDNNHKYIEQLYKNKIVEMQPKMMIIYIQMMVQDIMKISVN